MTLQPHPSLPLTVGIAVFIAWRLYKRVRRMVGRQTLHPVRPWLTVTLFPLLIAVLALASLAHPLNLLALAGGVALGALLGRYGLTLTKFEATPAGLFYTPNAHLGIALSLLLVLRLGWRAAQFYFIGDSLGAPDASAQMHFARSPLTLAIFGTLAGYYVRYAFGLLRWRSRAQAGASSPPGTPVA